MHNKNNSAPRAEETSVSESPQLACVPTDVTEAIKGLNPKQREVVIEAIRQTSFSGPIPHPELLQGYENVKQGFAERIVAMAEEQQKHRFGCENKIIDGSVSESKRGQWLAFFIAVLFLGVSAILGLYGHDWLAAVIGGGTLIALVTVFITGHRFKQEDEKNEKN